MIGEEELAKKAGMLRNMATQEQLEIPLGDEGIRILLEATVAGR
jgi:histidyl-tRNA synthetase